ncbi:MAG: tRNA (adenosine(37)-N6)-threonylcarbamoyltransferase complex ATPase subunit type 1 TsaE [Patescibacteria group bacterium]
MDIISKNTKPARLNIVSRSVGETEKIARLFLTKLNPIKTKATIVGLYGDLGTGKTNFTQAVAKYFGIKRKVNSPTFVIIKKYELPKKDGHESFLVDKTKPVPTGENFYERSAFKYLFHIDAYRLKNEKELIHLGWEEIISNPKHLIFIEWPANIIKAMPKKHHKIFISHTPKGHRSFKIKTI